MMTKSKVALKAWKLSIQIIKIHDKQLKVIMQLSASISEEQQQPIEIEVRKWDAPSFTIDGVNDHLEKLPKERK
ncbi:MAG: hypothetical protein M3250_08310 [Thermoproteota archaeon]|nr:hypothetical protein [Thermoproteota archaeon]